MRTVLFTACIALLASCGSHESVSVMESKTSTMKPYFSEKTYTLKKNPLDTNFYMAIGGWPSQAYYYDDFMDKVGPIFFEGDPLPVGTEISLFVVDDPIQMYKSEQGYSTSITPGKKLIARPADADNESTI